MWKDHPCKDLTCKRRDHTSKGHVCENHMWKDRVCEERVRKDQGGFSLVEVIIVIALMAVLAGSSVAMVGHIRYANTKKVAEEVDQALSRLRLETISRNGGRQVLFIYRVDNNGSDGYYVRLLEEGEDTANPNSKLDSNGTRLCGTNVIFSANGSTIEGMTYICIAFKKNGQIDESITNAHSIEIDGNGTYTITLDKETGRHFME